MKNQSKKWTRQKLINHVRHSLTKALRDESGIEDNALLEMGGMSGRRTRHFYNNLCSMEGARYLEIGTWTGSSFCSAMSGNEMVCTGIDNFIGVELDSSIADRETPKKEFLKNFTKHKGANKATFIEEDCWKVNARTLGKFNIYMYDGHHSAASHHNALSYYRSCLEDQFVYLVDDWNWPAVRQGTMHAIKKNKMRILWQKEVRTTSNDQHPPWDKEPYAGNRSEWHNGISIFVLDKSPFLSDNIPSISISSPLARRASIDPPIVGVGIKKLSST